MTNKSATHTLTSVIGRKICPKSKRSQEEMLGFVLIVILIAVIILVFLGFSLKKTKEGITDSYEVDNFIQAFLQYTTKCSEEYVSLRELIISCSNEEMCEEQDSCEKLRLILEDMINKSWKVEGDEPVKGYELKILKNKQKVISIEKSEKTEDYFGSMQDFSNRGNTIEIYFTAYN